MPRFSSREEYEQWKAARASGGTPGAPPTPDPGAAVPAAREKKAGFLAGFSDVPRWAWPFVAGCGAIPVVTLGGAVPFLLGFGGASLCASVAKRERIPIPLRVLASAVVTLAAWGLLAALLLLFAATK